MVSITGNLHKFSVGITRYSNLNTGFQFSNLYPFPRIQYWAKSHTFYNLHVGAVDFFKINFENLIFQHAATKFFEFHLMLISST